MNIVFVGTFGMAPKSTMKARALPLAQALAKRGHTVSMVLPPWDNPADAGVRWEDGGVSIINIGLPPRLPLAWYGALTWDLLRTVDDLHPDVVHAFKPKGFSGAVAQAVLMRRRGSIPRVVVDTDDWEGAGGWNEREGYPWWQQKLFALQERSLLRHADAVTAASRALEALTVETRASNQGVYYLPNGCSGPFPSPQPERVEALRQQLGLGEKSVLLLYTRFVECSPQRTLSLLQAVASTGARPAVLLVGTGLHGEEHAFLSLAKEAALPLRIAPVGWVEYESLPDYFALAHAALFPMEDTLLNRSKCPARLVDLLTAGVPVVGEAVGQVKEYVVDGKSGLLAEPDDLQELAETAVNLLDDGARRAALGQGACERMTTTYRWDLLADALEEAYQA